MSSILNDVKQTLGLLPDDTSFDLDIILHINSVFGNLNQLGVGPDEGFEIKDAADEWIGLFEAKYLNPIKSYVFLRVKLLFDPPTTGFATNSMERQITELEYRINVAAEYR